jgi:hypothetical protein
MSTKPPDLAQSHLRPLHTPVVVQACRPFSPSNVLSSLPLQGFSMKAVPFLERYCLAPHLIHLQGSLLDLALGIAPVFHSKVSFLENIQLNI